MARNLPVRRGSATARRRNAVWSPFAETEDLYDRMGQLMRAAWGDRWRPFGQDWAPLADLRETGDAYVVEMDSSPAGAAPPPGAHQQTPGTDLGRLPGSHHVDPSVLVIVDRAGRERRGWLCHAGYLGWSQLLYCQSSPSEN